MLNFEGTFKRTVEEPEEHEIVDVPVVWKRGGTIRLQGEAVFGESTAYVDLTWKRRGPENYAQLRVVVGPPAEWEPTQEHPLFKMPHDLRRWVNRDVSINDNLAGRFSLALIPRMPMFDVGTDRTDYYNMESLVAHVPVDKADPIFQSVGGWSFEALEEARNAT